MKLLNIILITMTLLLAFKPGIEGLFMARTSAQSCCIDICSEAELEWDAKSSDPSQDKDCEGNFCNPFQACGSCFLWCQSMPAAKLSAVAIIPQQKFTYQLNASALFTLEFWQPPESV